MTTGKRILTGLIATTMLFVATTAAQAAGKLSAQDKVFMVTLSHGNHNEIAASKIALKNSKDNKVKGVATTIIKEHGDNQVKLDALAGKYDVKLPHEPDAKHKMMGKQLASLHDKPFDNKYITGQIKDHHLTIALLQKEIATSKNSDVRSYATETLGHVMAHTDTIHKVAGTSNNMSMSGMGKMAPTGGKMPMGGGTKPMGGGNAPAPDAPPAGGNDTPVPPAH